MRKVRNLLDSGPIAIPCVPTIGSPWSIVAATSRFMFTNHSFTPLRVTWNHIWAGAKLFMVLLLVAGKKTRNPDMSPACAIVRAEALSSPKKKTQTAPPRRSWLSRAADEEVGGYCLLLWGRSSVLRRRWRRRRRRRRCGGGGSRAAAHQAQQSGQHGGDGGGGGGGVGGVASRVLVKCYQWREERIVADVLLESARW
jgi:hypothetical protein